MENARVGSSGNSFKNKTWYGFTIINALVAFIFLSLNYDPSARTTLRHQRKEEKYDQEESKNNNHNKNRFKSKVSSATSGKVFTGEVIRKWPSPPKTEKWDAAPKDGIISDGENCSNWAVVTTIFEPSEAVFRQAQVSGWCLVVVADKKSPAEYDVKWSDLTSANKSASNFSPRVEYLTPKRQRELWYSVFLEILPWNHFARKNVGYLYAIANGATRVWDFDDDNALYWWLRSDLPGVPSLDNIVSHIEGVGTALEVENFTHRVFNPYPMMGGPENSWPRGFPLQEIKNEESYVTSQRGRVGVEFREVKATSTSSSPIGVVQSLANQQPDVDAMYRLTQRAIPFDFNVLPERELRPVLVPPRALTPFNAQATLHLQPALWGLLLPISVPGRVSDIWRSYVVQRICWDVDVRIAFASEPMVVQTRNEHDILGDLESEQQLYQQANQLVDFLQEWHSPAPTLAERIEALWIALYERDYIQETDVGMVRRWLRALEAISYSFPKIQRSGPPLVRSVNIGEQEQHIVYPANTPMSKCPGVPRLTVWTSDLHDSTRTDIPTLLAELGMNVILGGIKRRQGPYPGVFEKTDVTVYDADLGEVITNYQSHSTALSDQDIQTNFEFWKNNPVMESVDLYFCSFPSSMCEMWLPFNKSIAFIPGHRYVLGRCSLETRNQLDARLQSMMQSTNPKHLFGALSRYDKEYLEYYLGTGPTSALHAYRTYATGFGYLWREAINPGPPLGFKRTEILSVATKYEFIGKLPAGVVELRSLYEHYTGAQLQEHPGIVLWAYSVMSYKLIDFYALAIPLYIPSLKFYHAYRFGPDRAYTGSPYYCNNQNLSSLFHKHPSTSHHLSPEGSSLEEEQYWLQFSDFYTLPHITYFDDLEDLVRKIARNDPLIIRKGMISENKKRLVDFKEQMCNALLGVEANRQTPSEYRNP